MVTKTRFINARSSRIYIFIPYFYSVTSLHISIHSRPIIYCYGVSYCIMPYGMPLMLEYQMYFVLILVYKYETHTSSSYMLYRSIVYCNVKVICDMLESKGGLSFEQCQVIGISCPVFRSASQGNHTVFQTICSQYPVSVFGSDQHSAAPWATHCK